MQTVSIADLNNAKADVDHIAAVATSPLATAVDRLGGIKDTLKGAIDTIKAFNARGAWTSAVSYAVKDIVTSAGTWYVCVTAHVSGATFATDSGTKWRVHQGLTGAELTASNGGETVADSLAALQLADYAALAAYVGPRKGVYVTGYLVSSAPIGISGLFIRDDSDTTSAANGGTIIVSANGKRWKRVLDETVSVEWFGATGAGNSTAAVQAAMIAAAPLNLWVVGQGKTYSVSTVSPLSKQRVRDLYLQSIGPLVGGAVSFQPVIEINGLSSLKTDMEFVNVRVNGRRDLFSNINSAAGEDGGMHAWRVVADAAGGVMNIRWRDCEGSNAGTAGLAIHSVNPASGAGAATYPIKNLVWVGGKLSGNREHGWFADAFNGLTIKDVDCRYNGVDLNTSDALSHGNRGARDTNGYLFGGGFDVESYGPTQVGSLWTNLTLRNLDCRACSMPAVLYNPIATNVAGYAPHSGISISDCQFDVGTASGADRMPNSDYSFSAVGNLIGTSYPYLDLIMAGNLFSGAAPKFNGVKGLTVSGGYINSAGVKAHIYNSLNWEVSANSSSIGLDIYPVLAPVFTKTQGSSGAVVASLTLARTVSKAGGELLLQLQGTITGGLNADGDLIFTTVSPVVGMTITELSVSCSAPIGVAVATCAAVSPSGVGTFWIDTVNGATAYFNASLVLSPAG